MKELDAAELRVACLLASAMQRVEFTAAHRIGEHFIRPIDGIKHLGIAGEGVLRTILTRLGRVGLVHRVWIRLWVDPQNCIVILELTGECG